MAKKIISVGVLLVMALSLFLFAGCFQYNLYQFTNDLIGIDDYEVQHIFLKKGEKVQLDFAEQFKDSGVSFVRAEANCVSKGIVSVTKKGRIKATGSGIAAVYVTIYNEEEYLQQTVVAAKVCVINPSKMTEIKTAQDLSNMRNNLKGNYILKADIDLKDFGNWEPIGYFGTDTVFRGMFVNPDGYKIKNLTVISETTYDDVGLFGSLARAYIDGLVLENVLIGKDSDVLPSDAGAIAGEARASIIRNCVVDGSVSAHSTAGGLAGFFSGSGGGISGDDLYDIGVMIGNSFKGDVEVVQGGSGQTTYGAGGLVGWCRDSTITGCSVEATVSGSYYTAGGIVGLYWEIYIKPEKAIADCFFSGELYAKYTGDMLGKTYS